MPPPSRDPLRPLADNANAIPLQPTSRDVQRNPTHAHTVKLAPIFYSTPRSSRLHALRDENDVPGPSARKRVKRDTEVEEDAEVDEADQQRPYLHPRIDRKASIVSYFSPSTPTAPRHTKRVDPEQSDRADHEAESSTAGLWRRKRSRLGVGAFRTHQASLEMPLTSTARPFLSSLVTSTAAYNPNTAPSQIYIPSQHPPTGRPREFSPPLCVAFNSVAKHSDAVSARAAGQRRLLAIGGEEGGVRILDVDDGMGVHREEKGWWWRAHGNAVFDIKFSANDSMILTASGDQTTRLHTLDTPVPRLRAILRGHTSSIKTTVFFDPTRSHLDPSVASSVVASSGRDGNILLYDLRCQGQLSLLNDAEDPSSPVSRRSRSRYSEGISGFTAQTDAPTLDPVMVIKGAHGDGAKRTSSQASFSSQDTRTALRSVTSLVAMQSMPGLLASGGSYDGIVKLWDLRFPGVSDKKATKPSAAPYGSLPDPTIHCSNPSRRPRSVNALVESPTTGDLFALCGDSKIHALRPAYAQASDLVDAEAAPDLSAILPGTYTDPNLLVSSFYLRASVSPDGKRLACGSGRGGLMTWDIGGKADARGEIGATRLSLGVKGGREVSAIDWGHDMLAACADDLATRIWRSKPYAGDLIKTADWWGQEP